MAHTLVLLCMAILMRDFAALKGGAAGAPPATALPPCAPAAARAAQAGEAGAAALRTLGDLVRLCLRLLARPAEALPLLARPLASPAAAAEPAPVAGAADAAARAPSGSVPVAGSKRGAGSLPAHGKPGGPLKRRGRPPGAGRRPGAQRTPGAGAWSAPGMGARKRPRLSEGAGDAAAAASGASGGGSGADCAGALQVLPLACGPAAACALFLPRPQRPAECRQAKVRWPPLPAGVCPLYAPLFWPAILRVSSP